jgi:hypothetical protein
MSSDRRRGDSIYSKRPDPQPEAIQQPSRRYDSARTRANSRIVTNVSCSAPMRRPKNPGKSSIFAKHSCDRLRLTNSRASDKFMGGQKGRSESLFAKRRIQAFS